MSLKIVNIKKIEHVQKKYRVVSPKIILCRIYLLNIQINVLRK